MKFTWSVMVAAAMLAVTSQNLKAQQPAPSRPAAPATQPTGPAVAADVKIAIIDTEAFADPKTGIVRLIRAFELLEREFKPRSDELLKL